MVVIGWLVVKLVVRPHGSDCFSAVGGRRYKRQGLEATKGATKLEAEGAASAHLWGWVACQTVLV